MNTLLTIDEVAELLQCARVTVTKMKLPFVKAEGIRNVRKVVPVEALASHMGLPLHALEEPFLLPKQVYARLKVGNKKKAAVGAKLPWVQVTSSKKGRRLPANYLHTLLRDWEKTAQLRA